MSDFDFLTEEKDLGKRIDVFLQETIKDKSRSYIQKCIRSEKVSVNNKPIKSNYILRVGDRILFDYLPNTEPDMSPENIPLDILYEDEDIIIINKPKNMVVHPAPGHYSGTLVNAVLYHCNGRLSGIGGVERPGIVHRIDKDTTGVLVVCKTDIAHQSLSKQISTHTIKRKYRAIVLGNFNENHFIIEKSIGRDYIDRKKMSVNAKTSKNAITEVNVLEQFKGYSYIECTLHTGRTHQIRVHLASIGRSVLGDMVYGPKKCPVKGLEGQCLHAYMLGFVHPTTQKYMEFTAPEPEYFQELLRRLKH